MPHQVIFNHPEVGQHIVDTGAERIAWGYALNTASFPTYAGEVIQILSCYVDDLEITGTLRSLSELEALYTYFLRYMQIATQGDPAIAKPVPGRTAFNQVPMKMTYPHRGWEFEIIPTAAPGFRKALEQVAFDWRLTAHVVAHEGDYDTVAEMIIEEAKIKDAVEFKASEGISFDGGFGLEGKIRFVDENPFSDPYTRKGSSFDEFRSEQFDKIADFYNKIIPSYLGGDFDALTGNIGSKPARGKPPVDTDRDPNGDGTAGAQNQVDTSTQHVPPKPPK